MCGVNNNPPPRPATPPPAAPPPAAAPPAAAPPAAAPPANNPAPLAEDASSGANAARDVKQPLVCDTQALEQAISGVAVLALGAAMLRGLGGGLCECGAVPQPTSANGCAPAGQALKVGGQEGGFPSNTVTTPGGYKIVPEGKDAAWRVYSPGQQFGDAPATRVWGDPHVSEADGTKWDFTKSSGFRLPDGTLIQAQTTSETGHSVTRGLNIVNGNDRVEINGIDDNKPTVSAAKADGRAWLAERADALRAGNTFSLETDGKSVKWFRSTNGVDEGLVTGSKNNVDGKNSYDQVLDGNQKQGAGTLDGIEKGLMKAFGENPLMAGLALFGALAFGGLGFLGKGSLADTIGSVDDMVRNNNLNRALTDLFSGNLARYGVRA